jgi:transcriptional regulator with XRE-family HTH domain
MHRSDKDESTDQGTPRYWPNGRARGVRRISYTHAALIDAIIANPCVSQRELATHFGYSAGWISQILASNVFQRRLAERLQELADPTLRAYVERQFDTLVRRSLDILSEKLDRPAVQIPDQLALLALELGARALGYGLRQPRAAPGSDVASHLEALSGHLMTLLQRRRR